MVKRKGRGKGGVTVFEQRRQERMGELEDIRGRKTTRKTLPKLEKALGITTMFSPIGEPVEEPKVPTGVSEPMEYTGKARRKTRRRKSTKRRK